MNDEMMNEVFVQNKARTKIKGNVISGEINGYMISGIVYSDGKIVLSIPKKQEVSQDLLEGLDFPDYINDLRYYNGKVDMLSAIKKFNVVEGERAIEKLIERLIENNIESNINYEELRIEEVNHYGIKVAMLFVLNVTISFIGALIVFVLQLGQTLNSVDGSFFIYYYVPFIFALIPFVLYVFSKRYFNTFSLVNNYDLQSQIKMEQSIIAIVSSVTIMTALFYIQYSGHRMLEITMTNALRNNFSLAHFFMTYDADIGTMFIMNVVLAVIGLTILSIQVFSTIKMLKRADQK